MSSTGEIPAACVPEGLRLTAEAALRFALFDLRIAAEGVELHWGTAAHLMNIKRMGRKGDGEETAGLAHMGRGRPRAVGLSIQLSPTMAAQVVLHEARHTWQLLVAADWGWSAAGREADAEKYSREAWPRFREHLGLPASPEIQAYSDGARAAREEGRMIAGERR